MAATTERVLGGRALDSVSRDISQMWGMDCGVRILHATVKLHVLNKGAGELAHEVVCSWETLFCQPIPLIFPVPYGILCSSIKPDLFKENSYLL